MIEDSVNEQDKTILANKIFFISDKKRLTLIMEQNFRELKEAYYFKKSTIVLNPIL
ncbi:hypothetical protein STRDD10_02011 [Streptococcus sp. DD10]|nr:hypothetical protein STRDD10_02011 [Streptococcus sp. DD10]